MGVLSATGGSSFPTGLSVRWRSGWSGEERGGAEGGRQEKMTQQKYNVRSRNTCVCRVVTVSLRQLGGGAEFGWRGSTDGRHPRHSTQGGAGGGGGAGQGATPPGD